MSLSNLSKSDQVFALSLMEQAKTKKLSSKQLYWLDILSKRAQTPIELPVEAPIAAPMNAKGIIDLLRRNNNAKRPKMCFLINDVEFNLSVAGSRARFPGSINVVANNVWYGRIHDDGRYEPSSRVDTARHTDVLKAMEEIAANPAKAAAEYGKKTGRCCFCFLPLSDHRSLEVGYGKICAKHYKLPWDASALETALSVRPLTNQQAFG